MDRAKFIGRKKIQEKLVVVLPGGDTLEIRKMTQAEVEHSRKHYGKSDSAAKGMRYMVATCTLNDDGTPMFDAKDIDGELADMPYDDIETIAGEVLKFSGVMKDEKKD